VSDDTGAGSHEASSHATLPRGVYEDASPPSGYRRLRMINGQGVELATLCFHTACDECPDQDPVVFLRAWLNESDPPVSPLRLLD
jgi:hypothetical protein